MKDLAMDLQKAHCIASKHSIKTGLIERGTSTV